MQQGFNGSNDELKSVLMVEANKLKQCKTCHLFPSKDKCS